MGGLIWLLEEVVDEIERYFSCFGVQFPLVGACSRVLPRCRSFVFSRLTQFVRDPPPEKRTHETIERGKTRNEQKVFG